MPRTTALVAEVNKSRYGTMPDGTAVDLFTLRNTHGVEVRAITYGATVVSLLAPDRDGRLDDIVLGFDSLPGYLTNSRYFGALVGRYANRIANARFTLDGVTYRLSANSGSHHLHGGTRGFDKVVWKGEPFTREGTVGVTFTYTSPDGDEGYPGTLNASVIYMLTPRNQLIMDCGATTDKATPVNFTQHSYFNLAGNGKGDVLEHLLTINADGFTPADDSMIPTGQLASVEGTPFDFRTPIAIGARIDRNDEQLRRAGGYDHNFVLKADRGSPGPHAAARVVEPTTGRTLDVLTTEPGVQFYSGNRLDGSAIGKRGHVYGARTGFCLETERFPDSPNHPNFPSAILRPGDTYRSRTIFAFGVTP